MTNSSTLSSFGSRVYAFATVVFGVTGLIWGDFATVWQPVQPGVPHRAALAYVFAALMLIGGAAIWWRATVRTGAAMLGVLYLICALLWLPRVIGYPHLIGTWSGFAEEFALAAAAIVIFGSVRPLTTRESSTNDWLETFGRSAFGVCAIFFGLAHLGALPQTAGMVPTWIPPNQQFWAIATGIAHLLGGIAILTGLFALPAARLLTVMFGVFGAFVWAPSLAANPRVHTVWAGTALNLAMMGAAWIVADSLARRERRSMR